MKRRITGLILSSLLPFCASAQPVDFSGVYGFGNSFLVLTQKGSQVVAVRTDLGGSGASSVGIGVPDGRVLNIDMTMQSLTCVYGVRYTLSENGQTVKGEYLSVNATPQAAMAGVVCQFPAVAMPTRDKIW